jgi:hypothetical protein
MGLGYAFPVAVAAYSVTLEQDILRAELARGASVPEMRALLEAVAQSSADCGRILIRAYPARAVFHVEREGLLPYFEQMARQPEHRIALLAGTDDIQASHEYLELIARQRGVNVRSFRSEAEALQWLRERRRADRR